MSTEETMEFDLALNFVRVTLKQDGVPIKCKLMELENSMRDKWLDGHLKKIRMGADGKAIGVTSFQDMQASLLVLSLVRESDDSHFTLEEIRKFPSGVANALFDKASTLSGLDEEAKKLAKND